MMNTETQTLIINILGAYAILSLIGLFSLMTFTHINDELILALLPITTSPISILGGFIAGKTLTEKQEETYFNENNTLQSVIDEDCV